MAAPVSSLGAPAADRERERDHVLTDLCEARIVPVPGSRVVFHGNPGPDLFLTGTLGVEVEQFGEILERAIFRRLCLMFCGGLDPVGDLDDFDDQRVHARDHVGGEGQGLSRHSAASPLIDLWILSEFGGESVPGDGAGISGERGR